MASTDIALERVRTEQRVAYERRRRRGFWIRMAKRLVIWIAIFFALAPFYLVLLGSVSDSFFGVPLIPHGITWDNYRVLFRDTDFLTWVKNSMLICFSVATISTVTSALSAYAFSRMRFVGRRYGLIAMLLIQMFPTTVALPAYYLVLLWLGQHSRVGGQTLLGLDTYQGLILILAGGGLAFVTWLAKGYFDNLPAELEEAAFVDGATRLRALWYVILPLAKPMLAVTFLFTFIGTYSEFILTSLIFTSNDKFTLPVGLRGFIDNQFAQHWTQFAAAAVLASIPIMLVFMAMQRYLVSGLARGAVKG